MISLNPRRLPFRCLAAAVLLFAVCRPASAQEERARTPRCISECVTHGEPFESDHRAIDARGIDLYTFEEAFEQRAHRSELHLAAGHVGACSHEERIAVFFRRHRDNDTFIARLSKFSYEVGADAVVEIEVHQRGVERRSLFQASQGALGARDDDDVVFGKELRGHGFGEDGMIFDHEKVHGHATCVVRRLFQLDART